MATTTLPKIYFERLLEISPDIVVAVDQRGRIAFYNDGAEETLGYSSEELRGEPVTKIYSSIDEARRVMEAMRGKQCETGKIKNFETTLITKTGEKLPVAISGSIIYDDEYRPAGSIGFAKDLREIRHRDQVITLAELCVSLSHEINNPLEAIGNNLNLLHAFLSSKCTDEEFIVEGDRVESIQRELRKIQGTLSRIQEMALEGTYWTREYLPGRLMTDLGKKAGEGARKLLAQEAEDASHPPGPNPPGQTDNGAESAKGELENMKVLVVDDDLGVCHSLRDLLLREGCAVRTATGGLQALDVIHREPVDIVLSDVVMPDMDGYDLYMELRDRRPELPVILMTAYYFDKDHVIKRSRLKGLGQVIFKKPINPVRLKSIIKQALDRSRRPAASRAVH